MRRTDFFTDFGILKETRCSICSRCCYALTQLTQSDNTCLELCIDCKNIVAIPCTVFKNALDIRHKSQRSILRSIVYVSSSKHYWPRHNTTQSALRDKTRGTKKAPCVLMLPYTGQEQNSQRRLHPQLRLPRKPDTSLGSSPHARITATPTTRKQ